MILALPTRPLLKVRTTTLVVGTTDLADLMHQTHLSLQSRSLPLMMIGSILFDLLMRTNALEVTPEEISQHVEVELEERLGWDNGHVWYEEVPQRLLFSLYEIMRTMIWPEIADHPTRKGTAVLQKLDQVRMEISMLRPERVQ